MPDFVPGLDLSRGFYDDVVSAILDSTPHAAARLGWGSDVLGFDTRRSTDHGWGPRVQIFVHQDEIEDVQSRVDAELPHDYAGWPTRFGWDDVPASHHVEVDSVASWFRRRLGFDPLSTPTIEDWLASPQQVLLEATAGAVFHDELGDLTCARAALAWYPDDIWLWLMACQWRRLDQEESFVGRTAEVGDELGARILTARLVRDAVRLCFLQERRYAPYSKWLGSAFVQLESAAEIVGPLGRALDASDTTAREDALITAVVALARRHNQLGVTDLVDEESRLFHSRPYRVLGSARFAEACFERVMEPALRALPLVGGVDQWIDSTDVLGEPSTLPAIRAAYDSWLTETG